MKELLESALDVIRAGETAAMATIVSARGSTPRAVGAKMLVYRDGSIRGTIGGGEMEQRVIQEARAALEAGQPRMAHYELREVEAGDVGACGGENDIFIEIIGARQELLVVGAGHVGLAVAELGAFVGMNVVVVDDRAEYANAERFPRAKAIIVGDVGAELARYPITRQSHIVIVTRGHQQDEIALAAVVRSKAAYIGMIGSRRKIAQVYKALEAQGVEREWLERVRAPIGLDIGSETPEEIAVSIVAQIIAVMRKESPAQS